MTLMDAIRKLIEMAPGKGDSIIIDGGCNVGQFASKALKDFPNSKVLSYEPDPESSEQAKRNLANQKNHELITAALGSEKGSSELFRGPVSATNSLLPRPDSNLKAYYPKEAYLEGGTMVDVVTIDDECSEREINNIDLLKLDLQGGELDALKGAENMLRSNSVKVIQTEAVFVRKYENQPLLWELWQYLEQFGYSLYTLTDVKVGLYDSKEVSLRNAQWNQCDVIFLSGPIREELDRDS